MKILIILLALTMGYSQKTDCCDSLMKLKKVKTSKSIYLKSTNGKTHDILISIDNSHSANNYASEQSQKLDSLNQQSTSPITIKDNQNDNKFNWWRDFFKLIIQFLIALAPLFILVFKYLTQKQKEFAERIIENKRTAYSEFLKNFTERAVKIMHDKDVDNAKEDRERMLARNQLLLYANDKVIQAYHTWVDYSDRENSNVNTEVELFGKLLIAIRKDIHGETKVTDEEISNLNPFNRG